MSFFSFKFQDMEMIQTSISEFREKSIFVNAWMALCGISLFSFSIVYRAEVGVLAACVFSIAGLVFYSSKYGSISHETPISEELLSSVNSEIIRNAIKFVLSFYLLVLIYCSVIFFFIGDSTFGGFCFSSTVCNREFPINGVGVFELISENLEREGMEPEANHLRLYSILSFFASLLGLVIGIVRYKAILIAALDEGKVLPGIMRTNIKNNGHLIIIAFLSCLGFSVSYYLLFRANTSYYSDNPTWAGPFFFIGDYSRPWFFVDYLNYATLVLAFWISGLLCWTSIFPAATSLARKISRRLM
jgi:hypothetical protein